MEILQSFKELGWRTKEAGGEKLISKQDGDNLVQAIIQHFDLTDGVKLAVSVSASSKAFCECCAKIMNRNKAHEPLCQTYLEKRYPDWSQLNLPSISEEIENWWMEQSIDDSIKCKIQSPADTGQTQLYHLAALALEGDFNRLMDYQQSFSKGQRMGFVPMIDAHVIDRALDIALEKI